MKTTVFLDKKSLAELLKLTSQKNYSLAVAFAVRSFIHRKKSKDFGRMLREGVFDYPASNEAAQR